MGPIPKGKGPFLLLDLIDLMKYQNASLQSKIQLEQKYKGMFGWLLKLFR